MELILRILWFLDLEDLVACQLTHRSLCDIIKDSDLLKYLRALKAAGMEDNRVCTIGSVSERLHMLRLREDAWATHLADFSLTAPVPVDAIFLQTYGFNGGTCFFGLFGMLYYLSMPSRVSNRIHWNCIDTQSYSIYAGFGIYEHDLIAINLSANEEVFTLSLLEASTRKPHPLAQNPIIYCIRSPACDGDIKIAGNYLALATMSFDKGEEINHIDVYEWKTGVLMMTVNAPEFSYRDVLFVSPKVLLVPNKRNNTLEFWNIPDFPETVPRTFPDGALGLPPLNDRSAISSISCKSAPFFGLCATRNSSIPFYTPATDAIAVFIITAMLPMDPNSSTVGFVMFSLVVHLQSLLDLRPAPSSPEFDTGMNVVPWDEWGPAVTRLLYMSSASRDIFSTDPSHRCVYSNENGETVILDFNPARIRSLMTTTPEDAEVNSSIITNESFLHDTCFEKPVASRLPYIKQIFPNTGAYYGVFIDDERVVGYRYRGGTKAISGLKIWHIGQDASEIAEG